MLSAEGLVCLKQATRAWNLQFHGVLEELGFTHTYSDAGVYVCHHHEGGDSLFVILYVNDITILGSSLDKINDLKKSPSSQYEMTDLGEIQSYFGVNITRDRVKFLTGNLCATCVRVSVDTGWSVGSHSVCQDPLCEEQGSAGRGKRRGEQGWRLSEGNKDKAREYHYN